MFCVTSNPQTTFAITLLRGSMAAILEFSHSWNKVLCNSQKFSHNLGQTLLLMSASTSISHPSTNYLRKHSPTWVNRRHLDFLTTCSYFYYTMRSKNVSTVNYSIWLKQRKNYWQEVLRRVVEAVKYLAIRGLAFRGDNEIFGSPNNGNYLGSLELIAHLVHFWNNISKSMSLKL